MVNAGNPIGAHETALIAPRATLIVDDLGYVCVGIDNRPVSCIG
jgi:hypothetical protein